MLATSAGPLATLLRGNVNAAITALQATEREFEGLSTDQRQKQVASIFFDDLHGSYEAALRQIPSPRVADITVPQVRLVVQDDRQAPKDYPAVAQTAFRALEQNELAYSVVADSGNINFDLEVSSTPAGAKVFYFRHGDKQPVSYQDPTNCTIHSLPLAVWIVRFEKEGYHAEEREHDPFRERNNTLHVDLQK